MITISCHIRLRRPVAAATAALLAVMSALLFQACGRATTLGYDDDDRQNGQTVHPSEVSVAYLRSLAVGNSTSIGRTLSVCGRVTATDAYGELYKSICVEDDTGGIYVEIDRFSLYTVFALYDRVRIECHGLALGRDGSTVRLGAPPTGEYTVDRIPDSQIGRYIAVEPGEGDFAPVVTTIGELAPAMVGRTVKISGLHALQSGCAWCGTDPLTGDFAATEHTVADDTGARLAVVLRGSCVYAAEAVPDGRFTLCGILEYRAGAYALRITNRGIIAGHD